MWFTGQPLRSCCVTDRRQVASALWASVSLSSTTLEEVVRYGFTPEHGGAPIPWL